MLERKFQSHLIRRLKELFPNVIILKNDSGYIQGIPDLLILYQDTWAALECKRFNKAVHQPNQEYYIAQLNTMSFAAFIYPENEQEVLDELQQTFKSRRPTFVSQR